MSSKDYFDNVAPQWDDIRSQLFPDSVREKALATANVKAGQIAGDIGAGSGFITEGLLTAGLRVVAVDQSMVMLDRMREKFGDAPVEYQTGSAEALPIPDETLDHAFANMYLHHVEQPALAIKEMARTLKPGGKLIITDMDEHAFEFLVTEQHDIWMGFKREAVQQWFEEAALNNVTVKGVNETCHATSDYGNEQATVSIFIAYGEK